MPRHRCRRFRTRPGVCENRSRSTRRGRLANGAFDLVRGVAAPHVKSLGKARFSTGAPRVGSALTLDTVPARASPASNGTPSPCDRAVGGLKMEPLPRSGKPPRELDVPVRAGRSRRGTRCTWSRPRHGTVRHAVQGLRGDARVALAGIVTHEVVRQHRTLFCPVEVGREAVRSGRRCSHISRRPLSPLAVKSADTRGPYP